MTCSDVYKPGCTLLMLPCPSRGGTAPTASSTRGARCARGGELVAERTAGGATGVWLPVSVSFSLSRAVGTPGGGRMLLTCWAAAAAVAVGLPAGASADDGGWQSNVVTLTESNFEQTVKAAEVLLVEFYGTPRAILPGALFPGA